MTALVVGLTVAVALLGVLVAGLLRANAEVVRAMHQMGVDLSPGSSGSQPTAVSLTARPTPGRPDANDVVDVAGITPDGDAVSLALGGVRHDTLVAFLTSGCQTCRGFWDAFRQGPPEVPGGAGSSWSRVARMQSPPARSPIWRTAVESPWSCRARPGSTTTSPTRRTSSTFRGQPAA